ncbi:MAG: hypothetical protein DRN07_07970 [Thermoplasmata archaeon]|nr:MAG: hypothetical protein DRN07_07970 [Thermoplasmata archaeon]
MKDKMMERLSFWENREIATAPFTVPFTFTIIPEHISPAQSMKSGRGGISAHMCDALHHMHSNPRFTA